MVLNPQTALEHGLAPLFQKEEKKKKKKASPLNILQAGPLINFLWHILFSVFWRDDSRKIFRFVIQCNGEELHYNYRYPVFLLSIAAIATKSVNNRTERKSNKMRTPKKQALNKRQLPNLSLAEKTQIIFLRKQGLLPYKIAVSMGCSKSTVQYNLKKWKKIRTILEKSRSGRPKKLSNFFEKLSSKALKLIVH